MSVRVTWGDEGEAHLCRENILYMYEYIYIPSPPPPSPHPSPLPPNLSLLCSSSLNPPSHSPGLGVLRAARGSFCVSFLFFFFFGLCDEEEAGGGGKDGRFTSSNICWRQEHVWTGGGGGGRGGVGTDGESMQDPAKVGPLSCWANLEAFCASLALPSLLLGPPLQINGALIELESGLREGLLVDTTQRRFDAVQWVGRRHKYRCCEFFLW